MVATRRGVRVSSPGQTNPDQASDVQATPSTARRTRRAAKQEASPPHPPPAAASPPSSSMKRCTRASRLHSPEQPCTPVGSVHEGDVSDLESCCSAVSDMEVTVTRTRTRSRRQPGTARQEDEEVSEVESCSSAVSASKAGQSSRRSTRRKKIPADVLVEAEDTKVDSVVEVESCSSVVSETPRVTRSQRRTTRLRSAAKQQPDDSELSDADSCTSSVSGVSKSTTRRSTRTRKQTGPIPIHLDETSDGSVSPARRTRASRGKAATDVSEPPSCDSEGFESGPTYSISTRRRRGASRSDCELSEVGSPCSTRSRGTPSSSRTGSGNSSRGVRVSSHSIKDLSIVIERAAEQTEEETTLNDSRLETTVISEDANNTLVEVEKSQIVEEKEEVSCIDLTSEDVDTMSTVKVVSVISDEDSTASPLITEEAVGAAAVTVRHQQEEPCVEQKLGDTSDEMMQETAPSSELTQPCQSVTVTLCNTSEITGETETKDEAMEEADADTCSVKGDEDAVVENRPCEEEEEEKIEVVTVNQDDQQVVDSAEVRADDAIEVTCSQQHKITVDSAPQQAPGDVTVEKTRGISLLESSDDEESEEEYEVEVSGGEEEEEDDGAVERAGPSKHGDAADAADASVQGLFMIDTRPGEQTNEQYYKETPTEQEKQQQQQQQQQEEEEEEFVDEEGDDDDDEDANILFASRNPLLKEMSSRIDPGIKVKELGGLYINFDGSKSKPASSSQQKLNEKKIQDEVMKKSVMGPEFEKKEAVPPYSESKQALKLKHRAEREKSTGDGWFNMKAPELTSELKGDLRVLKMRGSMDSKRFYKKNDRDGFPKYFQIGTVMDNAADFYHSRIPKKQRKRTMVEELLSDAEFRHNNKKKYQNIVAEKAAQGSGRRNKKKKFHKKQI